MFLANLAILVLAGFVGFAVISKVPNTLHTPLMSGTNAIHGIVLLGGLIVLGTYATGVFDDADRQANARVEAIIAANLAGPVHGSVARRATVVAPRPAT